MPMQTLLRYRGYVILSLVWALVLGGVVLYERRPHPEPIEISTPVPTSLPTSAPIMVHVVGAVRQPGVYRLPPNSRLVDAVEAAGGLGEAADASAVNLADFVRDGQQVYVPAAGVAPPPSPTPLLPAVGVRSGASVDTGHVNVNTATLAELDGLPGIGPVYAQRIIDYRTQHGAFTDPAQLLDVAGIGPATYERLKDLVTVD